VHLIFPVIVDYMKIDVSAPGRIVDWRRRVIALGSDTAFGLHGGTDPHNDIELSASGSALRDLHTREWHAIHSAIAIMFPASLDDEASPYIRCRKCRFDEAVQQ
jgi:hypothetical protein